MKSYCSRKITDKDLYQIFGVEFQNTKSVFKEDDESHLCWFRDSSVGSDDSGRDFFLMGIICALAIYNDNIVDLKFPLALYKKLLRQSVSLIDLKELSPTVGQKRVKNIF